MIWISFYRSNYIVRDRGEHPAANPAVAAGCGNLAPRLDPDEAVFDSGGVNGKLFGAVLQAAARYQAEMLLVDRRGDDQLAPDVADYAARYDIGAGEGIVVADGVHAVVVQPEERDLLAAHQRAYAGIGHDIRQRANLMQLQLPVPWDGPGGSGRARRRR